MFVYELFDSNPNVAPVNENDDSHGAVQSAIIRRIMTQHKEALVAHGPVTIMQAAEEVADRVGNVDEIGTSDISAWTREALSICKELGRT
jgi:hypothetical protein